MAPANPELRELVKEMNRSVIAGRFQKENCEPLDAAGEIYPTAILPVLAINRAGEERVFPMKWGFNQRGRLLINARAETAAEKLTFRESWKSHRCIIPVSCYFEWEHDEKRRPGQKYAIRPVMPGVIHLAGLYRMEEEIPVFVILTRPAAKSLAWMHDRMPVMLSTDKAKEWIQPGTNPDDIMKHCLTETHWYKAG